MVRTTATILFIFGLGVLASAPAAHAQRVKIGGPNGTIQTGIGTAAISGGVFGTILSAPQGTPADKGFLIVTSFCSTAFVNGLVTLVGSTLGDIASVSNSGCIDFATGLAIPAGEDLSCRNDGNSGTDTNCMVSGVRTRK